MKQVIEERSTDYRDVKPALLLLFAKDKLHQGISYNAKAVRGMHDNAEARDNLEWSNAALRDGLNIVHELQSQLAFVESPPRSAPSPPKAVVGGSIWYVIALGFLLGVLAGVLR